MPDRLDPDKMFKDHPGATLAPPWEPFWTCTNFASKECSGVCEQCVTPKNEMELRA